MRICFIPQAFRGKGLPTLRLLSLLQKKDLRAISSSLAKVYECPANFSATGQDLTCFFVVVWFYFLGLFFSSQWAVLWHQAHHVWAFKRKKLGRAVSLDLLPQRLGYAGLAVLLPPIPQSCPFPGSCWTPHSGEVMESLLSSPSHHLIVPLLWILTPPNGSFPVRENPIQWFPLLKEDCYKLGKTLSKI